MWTCKTCNEEHEDQFDSCWKCEGENFKREVGSGRAEKHMDTPSLDDVIAEKFKCPKCASMGASVKRIAATGTGLSKMFDIQYHSFIAASCKKCGLVQFYDPEVLEGSSSMGTIIDILMG